MRNFLSLASPVHLCTKRFSYNNLDPSSYSVFPSAFALIYSSRILLHFTGRASLCWALQKAPLFMGIFSGIRDGSSSRKKIHLRVWNFVDHRSSLIEQCFTSRLSLETNNITSHARRHQEVSQTLTGIFIHLFTYARNGYKNCIIKMISTLSADTHHYTRNKRRQVACRRSEIVFRE